MNALQTINTPVSLSFQSSSARLGNPVSKWNEYGKTGSTASFRITKYYNIKQKKTKRNGLILAIFGFEKGERYGIEKATAKLIKEASSLLVYQDILNRPPAKAFLDVLDGIRTRRPDSTVLRLYGVFFKLMASGCFSSWQDFVLDSILAGEGSPFAIAASNVGNPQSVWSSGIPKSLRLAAASDLDILQTLSITESTLAGWVADLVSENSNVKRDWKLAATSNIGSFSRDNALEMTTLHTAEFSEVQKEELAKTYKKVDDIMEIDREMWRKKIGDLVRWSEAVPLLEDYYATHSYGKLASVTVFRWETEKLVRNKSFYLRHKSFCDFSHQRTHLESLQKNFRKHASGSPAQHVLLSGPSGVGKTQLLRAAVHDFSQKGQLRIVSFSSNELKTLHKLLEDIAHHWQLRFVILIDDLILKGGDGHIRLLKLSLDRMCQDLPSNVILCGTSTHSSQAEDGYLSFSNLRSTFGVIIKMKDLNLEEYLLCVEELLNFKLRLFPSMTVNMEDFLHRAKEWVESQNVYTVQDASQFVNSFIHSD